MVASVLQAWYPRASDPSGLERVPQNHVERASALPFENRSLPSLCGEATVLAVHTLKHAPHSEMYCLLEARVATMNK